MISISNTEIVVITPSGTDGAKNLIVELDATYKSAAETFTYEASPY